MTIFMYLYEGDARVFENLLRLRQDAYQRLYRRMHTPAGPCIIKLIRTLRINTNIYIYCPFVGSHQETGQKYVSLTLTLRLTISTKRKIERIFCSFR